MYTILPQCIALEEPLTAGKHLIVVRGVTATTTETQIRKQKITTFLG